MHRKQKSSNRKVQWKGTGRQCHTITQYNVERMMRIMVYHLQLPIQFFKLARGVWMVEALSPACCDLQNSRHGPCRSLQQTTLFKQIAWVSDSRVGNNSVVEHRSRRPVLSPLRNCLDRCHVRPHWASRCKPWRWMLKDVSIHVPL